MICILGPARSGTSVLFQCLVNSGYYRGPDKFIHGHKYLSEHHIFKLFNEFLSEKYWFLAQASKTGSLSSRHNINVQDKNKARCVFDILMDQKVEILKDAFHIYTAPFWAEMFPHEFFQGGKYIVTYRDEDESAKSIVRLRKGLGNALKTVSHMKKHYAMVNAIIKTYLGNFTYIKVEYDDMLHNTADVQQRLSEFLGRDIDMSIISASETFKENRSLVN